MVDEPLRRTLYAEKRSLAIAPQAMLRRTHFQALPGQTCGALRLLAPPGGSLSHIKYEQNTVDGELPEYNLTPPRHPHTL